VIKTDSVSKLNYFGPEYEYIASISHMETFSIYKFDQGELVKSYGDCRNGADYLIDSYYDPQCQELSLIGGTREGAVCLFDVQIDGLQLVATINGGHDDIITDCHVEPGRIISAGEDGKICSWVIDN
jgi:WD40 repeat protein